MVEIKTVYKGEKHCEAVHGPSQSFLETDAPKDNNGRGEKFSPTDLVATALATCVLTTMAIVAERDGVDFTKASATVEKHMNASPRRIGKLVLRLTLPSNLTPEYRRKMENTAHACPVHKSLHPDVEIPIEFIYEA